MTLHTSTDETGVATRVDTSSELTPTASSAAQQAEIHMAIAVAKRFKRNPDEAFAELMRSCDRSTFADECVYEFPRGGSTVTGPSVHLAREAARVWGNLRYGFDIVRDDENSRQITGWAWDVQSNTRTSQQDDFAKLVQRKTKSGGVAWVKPDERDLRELTNRRAAILVRNCLLQLLPKDLIDDAIARAAATLEKGAAQNPDAARKKLVLAFSALGITVDMLETYLRHPLAATTPPELATLRTVYKSLADGNSTWLDYVPPTPVETATVPAEIVGSPTPNRGHGDERLDAVGKKKER